MKKRSMILALASMLGISAAATAVSGFAWFTTTTTATVAEHSYKVGAAQGSLKVTKADENVNCKSSVSEANVATITPTNKNFADVSSIDGKDFFKLYDIGTITTGENSAKTAPATIKKEAAMPAGTAEGAAYMSSVNANQMVAVSWALNVQNQGTEATDMNVYLSKGGALFTAADDTNYADCYRMAIYDDSATLVYFYSTAATGFKADGLTLDSNNQQNSNFNLDGNGTVAKYANTCTEINSAADVGDHSTVGADKQILCTLGAQATKKLTFIVWCEGTITPDAPIANVANSVKLSFGLIGLKAA